MNGDVAQALWITSAGKVELRSENHVAAHGDLEIKTLYSGISRGTERLVLEGRVPPSEYETMRAPFQAGSFEFPLKYGYSCVGEVQNTERAGEMVFALFPHQTRFFVPAGSAVPLPAGLPASRAVLAANMETALTIVWDAGIGPGDKVVVVGAGVVGAMTGFIAAQIPGVEVCLVDIDPSKADLAQQFGCAFALPDSAPGEADVVVHASASQPGLTTAISLAGLEAVIVEASWYGTGTTQVPLGGAFHQRRLKIIGSQVGRIPAQRLPRWTHRRRIEKALQLLLDPRLDILISGESSFEALPDEYISVLNDPRTLCHRVRY